MPPGTAATPGNLDLRTGLPAVRDQGDRGTCLAFAVTAAHEFCGQEASYGALSEEGLYWSCKKEDGDWESGTTFQAAKAALVRTGQPRAAAWPYKIHRQPGPYGPPPPAKSGSAWYKARLRKTDPTTAGVIQELAEGRLVAVGFRLTREFFFSAKGHIPVPTSAAPDYGGHAVSVVGVLRSAGEPALIVRNSWGPSWGDGGYGYMPKSFFDRRVMGAWVIEEIGL